MRKSFFNKFFLVFVFFIFLFIGSSNYTLAYENEITNISSILSKAIVQAGKNTIAVVDFTDLQGNVTELGRFLAEELSVSLATSEEERFDVVDRTHLRSILQEHKLALTGVIDPSSARQLGKIAGVDALVTATITPFGDNVRLSVKILDTLTAKILGSISSNIAKTKAIEELLSREVKLGTSSVSILPPSTSTVKPKTIKKVIVRNFTIEMTRCKRTGDRITCNLLITNNEQDRELGVWYRGRTVENLPPKIFDDFGNEYWANSVQLANKETQFDYKYGWTGADDILKHLFILGISTKLCFYFDGVEPGSKNVALFEFWLRESDKNIKIQFRNIPITE